jgi:hypothetical protein
MLSENSLFIFIHTIHEGNECAYYMAKLSVLFYYDHRLSPQLDLIIFFWQIFQNKKPQLVMNLVLSKFLIANPTTSGPVCFDNECACEHIPPKQLCNRDENNNNIIYYYGLIDLLVPVCS